MSAERHRYIAYLLRLWQVRTGSELVWRASLESPYTSERIGFADLEALFAFLRQRTGVVPDAGGSEGEDGSD